MQPLNIFFLHPSDLLTDHVPHGDGLLAFKFIRGLADRGHNVHVAVERAEIQSCLPANLHIHHVHPAGTSRRLSRLAHPWRSRVLYNKLAQTTTFHLLHQTNPATTGMSLAFAGLGIPLIVGPYVPDWPPTSRSLRSQVAISLSRLARLPLLELQHFQASQIILSTPAARQKFQWPGVYQHKISVLPYGIDLDNFHPVPRQTEKKTILFLAHVHRFKGVFDLFEAFEMVAKEFPALDLVIAGPGDDLEELKARAKRSAFADRVRFLGKVARDKVAAVMADCDIYCLPSVGEPFGMTALEAMACGRALVATDAGGLGWLVPDDGGLKVAPGQPQQLAQAFRHILSDPQRSGQMGAFNRTRAETTYAWPKILDGLESIYQAALKNSPALVMKEKPRLNSRLRGDMSDSGFASPRFSVVISSYNYARFLKECIESVLTQAYPGTEVIVVDDGSTDHSQEVINSFGNAVTAIFKSNGGQSSSWNVGIARASGDVIVLVDSDDRLVPGILRDYAKVFEQAGVVRCQGYTTVISEDGTLTGERVPESRPEELDLQQKVLSFGPGSYICTPTSGNAWSAAFLKQLLPLPESNVSGPDGLLFLAAPLYGKTVTVDRASACFRIHESSVSHKISGLNAKNMRKTIKAYENHCEWLKFVAKSRSLIADQKTWDRKNWRIASLRYLLSKVEPNGASSQIWEHIGTIRGARTVKTRFLLFFFLLALRLAPLQQALWLASRKINLRHMPI